LPTLALAVAVVVANTVSFEIKTVNEDNRRAGKQVLRIRKEINEILRQFG